MNTVPVPKVDVVKPKSALWVTWKNSPLTLGFAANDPVWDFDCRECKASRYVVAEAIKLEPVSTQTVSGLYFIHNDHRTPKLITNTSGNVVWQQHTTPFGEIQETLATGINNLKSFPGQYRDSETGYSYNYFRDYDPTIGRYIQSDPIGLGGGLNTYGYALQNPVMYTDLLGLYSTMQMCAENPQATEACAAAGITPNVPTAAANAAAATAGAGISQMNESSEPNDPDTYRDEGFWERIADRRAYHQQCDQKPPEDNFVDQFTNKENRCNRAKWELEKWRACKQMREGFTNKWYDGKIDDEHVDQINQVIRSIEKAESNVRRYCDPDCINKLGL